MNDQKPMPMADPSYEHVPMEQRIEARVALFRTACKEWEIVVSGDGLVGATDAAKLLGLVPGTLRNMRSTGRGPSYIKLPGGRCRYDLRKLALWHEEAVDAALDDAG
jgi:hypothetical protein